MSAYLKPFTEQDLKTYLTEREGETKMGQAVQLLNGRKIADSDARFVLLGIPEDIGVRANWGKPGTALFWPEFLKIFLNIQSNLFLKGENILLAGTIDCSDLMQLAEGMEVTGLPALVEKIDQRVETVLVEIFRTGKIPVIIGGGHNNAYPIIRAASKATGKKTGIVNIDPHADLRATGQRHSGNGFSYALQEDLLQSYVQVGLHESYNNNHILELYKANPGRLHYFSFDDFLKEKWSMGDLQAFLRDNFNEAPTGFELDTDSIEHFPSSAQTPTGFSTNDARKLTIMVAQTVKPIYFHLPEAIPATSPVNSMKMAAYLVSDFIKNR